MRPIGFLLHGSIALALSTISLAVATSPWAADGWYLLIPPRSEYNERAAFLSGYKILDNTPLSQWGQQGAYDSASECEATRNVLLKVEQRVYSSSSEAYLKAVGAGTDSVVLKAQRFVTERNNANVWAFMASRCIRSDDPRLRR
jgi:hypothetical protein